MMSQRGTTSTRGSAWKLQLPGTLALLLVCVTTHVHSGDATLEYQVKAAFLLNFLKFVEWPQDGTQAVKPGTPLIVGVYGDNPFGAAFENTFSGKTVDGHPVQLRFCSSEEDAGACHLVFVSNGRKLTPLLENLQNKNVLTVGESGDFLRAGGAIRFLIEDERVRFEISLAAADRARLRISAKLLQLARKVYRKGDQP